MTDDEQLKSEPEAPPADAPQEVAQTETAAPESQGESPPAPGTESIDDMVERQMLAELEKLDSTQAAAPPPVAHSETEDSRQVRRPDFQMFGKRETPSTERNLELLLDVNLPISIELGRTTMKIKEILNLGPGSVVELKKLAGEPVDLLVNNRVVARGEVVVVDENFGLRITSLLSPEERLRSLE